MSLQHILLGIIAEPKSGYDIKQEFDSSLKHFWFAELSQIYPALKKLVADDLARVEGVPSDKGPDKKLYSRTNAGTQALIDWLHTGPATSPVRHGFLGQVFFMGTQKDREAALKFFKELKAHYQARYAALQAVEAGWKAQCPTYPDGLGDDDFFMQMTLDAGLRFQRSYMDWCTNSIDRIKSRYHD
ncbi:MULTISPECIES: PadR family transcriptional regulator [Kordiimonas]|mgnify:CR=1 FL=1|jgi:DNA-binding PadR family transcriptional regulator|uniref:PadR family transcriptional regulator n=1 Tax=Kordiimonas TaxID=288021 RepID=UPI00257CF028|nr:PadR family transcriptional regulator [Kordiimonas sp. UBA4487]